MDNQGNIYLSKEAVNTILSLRNDKAYQEECSIITESCCTLLRLLNFADKGFTIEELKDDLINLGGLIVSYKNIVEALADEDNNFNFK